MEEEVLVAVHRTVGQMPAGRDGRDFAIGGDTLVLEAALMGVRHYYCHLPIHLLHLTMLARAMDRARSRQSTLVPKGM